MKNKQFSLEEVIVGIILRDPIVISTKTIDLRWFDECREVIKAMQSIFSSGNDIDVLTVNDELGGHSLEWLVNIHRYTHGSKENFSLYVGQLQQQFTDKIVAEAIDRAASDINNGTSSTEVINKLIAEAMKINSADDKTWLHTAKSGMNVFVDQLTEIFDARESGGIGLKTQIQALDDELGGMHPSDMIIVGARPGEGKTAMSVTVMSNLAKTGKKIGFFSTEMPVFQVMSRFVAMQANIHGAKLRQADLDDNDYARLSAATAVIAGYNLRICDKPVITAGEIAMQARAWMADGGIDFIVIDYLTRVHPDKNTGNRNVDVGEIVTSMKNIARTLNIPVMVLAQLNRSGSSRADKRPIMSDLRDSGVIEQEADSILMLHRDDDGDEIIIEKNRHGGTGIVRCYFNKSIMKWQGIEL